MIDLRAAPKNNAHTKPTRTEKIGWPLWFAPATTRTAMLSIAGRTVDTGPSNLPRDVDKHSYATTARRRLHEVRKILKPSHPLGQAFRVPMANSDAPGWLGRQGDGVLAAHVAHHDRRTRGSTPATMHFIPA